MKRPVVSSESHHFLSPGGVAHGAVLITLLRRLTVVGSMWQIWMLLVGSSGSSFYAGLGNLCWKALQGKRWDLHVSECWRLLLLMGITGSSQIMFTHFISIEDFLRAAGQVHRCLLVSASYQENVPSFSHLHLLHWGDASLWGKGYFYTRRLCTVLCTTGLSSSQGKKKPSSRIKNKY